MSSRTITNAADELLPQNANRKSFVIQNEDSTIDVFIKFESPGGLSVSTTDHDHRLGAGDALGLSTVADGRREIQERITVIAASGTPRVSFFETQDLRK